MLGRANAGQLELEAGPNIECARAKPITRESGGYQGSWEVIDAFQWMGEPGQIESTEWLRDTFESGAAFFLGHVAPNIRMIIGTLHGCEIASPGDWIVRHASGRIHIGKIIPFHSIHEPDSRNQPVRGQLEVAA